MTLWRSSVARVRWEVADQTARDPEDRGARRDADLALALLDDEPEIRDVHRVAVLFYPVLYFVVPLKYAITRVPVVSGHLLHC